MDPGELLRWERILHSDVAILLLLIAGIFAVSTAQAVWIVRLYRDNRELHREFQEHLKAQGQLAPLLEGMRSVLALNRGDP